MREQIILVCGGYARIAAGAAILSDRLDAICISLLEAEALGIAEPEPLAIEPPKVRPVQKVGYYGQTKYFEQPQFKGYMGSRRRYK